MKVNPAFVFILIIATSLAIHLSTHIQPSHWLWGCSELGLLSWPTHLLLRCLRSSSCGGLKWGSYRSPHTFSKASSPVVMGRSNLGLISWPLHTFHLRCLRPLSWGGRILLQLRCFKVAPKKFSTTMCTMGEITATDYIERETCGILLAILHLDFYVWSFCAFLLDSSTYTNSLWCLRLSS
jgi:hypothetical protein